MSNKHGEGLMAGAFDRWLGRTAGVWTFFAPLAPGTLGGLVTATLSQSVAWINQWGWFGWWCAFILGGLLIQIILTLYSLFKLQIVKSRAIFKWSQTVDSIDPMQSIFENKRIRFRDLAHPFTNRIEKKTFKDCELFGQENIIFLRNTISEVNFRNCDFVILKDDLSIKNVIAIKNSHIIGGEIWNCVIFSDQEEYNNMKYLMPTIESQSYPKP